MPRLPANMVQPPVFDNPLRRTMPIEDGHPTAPVVGDDTKDNVIALTPAAPRLSEASNDAEASMLQRITVRIDDATWRTLQTECFERRLAGEKTNVADIARNVLKSWAKRQR